MALIVNGEFVEDDRFIRVFRQLGGFEIDPAVKGGQREAARLRQVAERRVVSQVLLCQMALKAGFDVSAEEVNERRTQQWGTSSASVCGIAVQRELANEVLVGKFCQWLCRHEPRPSRVEVEHYYTQHRTEYLLPERVKAAHIVCNIEWPADEDGARARIEQAEHELVQGAVFAKVAVRYSDCGGKAILGWVARGAMVPEFEEVVFALPEGSRSGIFRTIFGFHIATVLERKAAGIQPLEELRPMLARRILEERRHCVVEGTTEQAIRAASIEVAPAEKVIA
jgi:parvulin-like peptidyl-prolyl isomerase